MSLIVFEVHIFDSIVFVLLVGVRVDLRAGDILVSEKLLHGPQVRDSITPGGESMTQTVRIHGPAERGDRGGADDPVNMPSSKRLERLTGRESKSIRIRQNGRPVKQEHFFQGFTEPAADRDLSLFLVFGDFLPDNERRHR